MKFSEWKTLREGRRELGQDFRSRYSGVPQEPTHHPEGDVFVHTRMVRKSVPIAIRELRMLKANHPQLSQVLSDLDLSITPEEERILAMASWLHDVGKVTATKIGGQDWKTPNATGKVTALGHETPEYYGPEIELLSKSAPKETVDFYKKHQLVIDFLILRHMDFAMGGFSKENNQVFFQNGKIKNHPWIKLLLILMWSDKLGRGFPEDRILMSLNKNQGLLWDAAEKSRIRDSKPKKQAFEGTPADLVKHLTNKPMVRQQRIQALRGKFPDLRDDEINQLMPESMRYVESAQGPKTMKINIPVDKEVHALHEFLTEGDPRIQVYMVGGAVRDFLYHMFKGSPGSSYKHKDIDLTTNLSEEQILQKLGPGTPAEKAGVKVNEKESDTFGVVFVNYNGKDYEIAPFRKDIGSTDGRRPDRVEQADIIEDAMRRDLTINNLYYDFQHNVVLDFNANGQGISDVANGIARPVGDPFERFNEDKLRVLRLVRFFSRFNSGSAVDQLDANTLRAIENFKDLQSHGITAERIASEFVAGLKQAQHIPAYLQNYANLDLIKTVFPRLHVDQEGIYKLNHTKNPRVIFAWLLRNNPNVDSALINLKYESSFAKSVRFLIDAMNMNAEQIYQFVQGRDRRLPDATRATIKQDLGELALVSGHPEIARRLMHFRDYQAPAIDSQMLMKQGFRGAEIGQEMNRQTTDHYKKSFEEF